jgi:4-hydroxythreonine-4-phosphate dehydrogenase
VGKPKIAITMGEPAGVGPELLLKAVEEVKEFCTPVIVGSASFLFERAEREGRKLDLSVTEEERLNEFGGCIIDVCKLGRIDPGKATEESARAALSFIDKAVELACKARVDAVVTSPVCKHTIDRLGVKFLGHTDYIAERLNVKDYRMVFFTQRVAVALTTVHVPLRNVPSLITEERVFVTIKMLHAALSRIHKRECKIAVSGLNPHAGEEGLFGNEEERIKDAIKRAKDEEMNVEGPFPPDTLFHILEKEGFDAAVCMYHDQALMPVKLLFFDEAVNLTLGLPFVRTSPAHGVAFDIAGKGVASPRSLLNAIRCAVSLL